MVTGRPCYSPNLQETLHTLLKYGYQSVFLLLFMEAIGLPVPGAIVLLAAGAASASGLLSPGLTVVLAFLAMLLGDTLLYVVGRRTGWILLGVLCRVSLNPETCILRSAESFYQRGRKALVFAKFIPGINTMAPPLAGSMQMGAGTFLWLDFWGATLYISAFWIPGYLFSELLKNMVLGVQAFGTVVEWVVGIALVIYVAYRLYYSWTHSQFGIAPKVEVSVLSALMNAPNPPPMMIADVRSHGYYDKGALRIQGSVRLEPNHLTAMLPTRRSISTALDYAKPLAPVWRTSCVNMDCKPTSSWAG
jgi:membrane protein DedA with SNARE-associated domain